MATALVLVALIILVQSIAGSLIWLWVRRGAVSFVEAAGMGLVIGSVIAALGSQVTIAAVGSGWGWLVVVVLGFVAWLGSRLAWWSLGTIELGPRRDLLILIPAAVIGFIALVPSILLTPLRNGYVVGGVYQPDVVFFEALAQSVSVWGAHDNSMLVGEPIKYHWLSYAWIGNLTEVSGAGDFTVMTRVFPVVIVIAAVFLAAAWARLLSPVWWVPGLAALLVVAGGYVGASQGVALTYDSPSTAYAVILGLAFGLVLTLILRAHPGSSSVGLLVMMGVVSFALVGAKASQALVIAVGVAGVFVWSFVSRSVGRVWPMVLASGLGMLGGYLVFLFGVAGDETNIGVSGTQEHASTFQGFDPVGGPLGIALGTAALLLAILPRWLGALWVARRLPGEFAFVVGLVVAAVGTLAVLRSGTNSAWFALASTALIAVVASAGVGVALERVGYSFEPSRWVKDPVVWAVIAAVGINIVVLVNYALAAVSGAAVLWRGPVLAWLLAIIIAVLVSRSRALTGGRWLRWTAMVTVILTLTSIGARANGSIVWGLAHSRATPVVQDFIRFFDPDAEFTASAASDPVKVTGGWRAASVGVRAEDLRGASDGVARRESIIQWTPSMNDAALLLRDLSDREDVVAVSRPALQPFLPIVSERRAWVAGIPYSTGYTTADGIAAAEARMATVQRLLTQPDAAVVEEVIAAGVQWLWITPESFASLPSLEPWTEEITSDPDVVLLRLIAPGASSS